LWFVTDYALAKTPVKIQPPQNEVPQIESPQIDRAAPSKQERSSIKLRDHLHQNDVEVKKSTDISEIQKNSLSAKIESDTIQNYFEGIKSVRKLESEKQAFLEIQSLHPIESIDKGLAYVLKNGTPPKGEPCHSPMAFLAKAINDVLTVANKQEEEAQRRQNNVRLRQATIDSLKEKELTQAASDQEAEEQSAIQEQAFIKKFPSENEQSEALLKYCHLFPMMNPRGQIYRKLAIAAWSKGIQQGENQ
jgi:hypothetical protein